MHRLLSRLLLALSATILIIGGFIHAASFLRAQVALAGSGLPAHLVAAFKMLWLADSTTLFSVALVFGYIALRPDAIVRALVFGIALVPVATTALLFVFLGTVPATVMLTVATTAALCGGLLLPQNTDVKADIRAKL